MCSLLNIGIVKPKPLAPPRLPPSFWARPKLLGRTPFLCGCATSSQFAARPGLFQLRCCEERVAS